MALYDNLDGGALFRRKGGSLRGGCGSLPGDARTARLVVGLAVARGSLPCLGVGLGDALLGGVLGHGDGLGGVREAVGHLRL